jgi:ubiquinone/menaquinone biosynthesis C-methylase UbiE
MAEEKSLFYYGWLYHRLFDPPLAEAREVAMDLVGDGSSVVDIGCGTGLLCSALRVRKHCRVVGIDLSLRMLDFAKERNRFDDVTFVHLNAADLSGLGDRSFQYATILFLMHELARE